MPIGSGNTQKVMSVILKAKDMTAHAFKTMKENGKESIKALKQGFKALEVAVLGFATAILATGVMALKKMITIAKDLAIGAVNTAASFEALEMQFGVMLGSAQKGKEIFDDLWKVAQQIPFTIDDIAVSARSLKAWGVLGKDVETAMIGVADATAITGRSMEEISTVIGRAWQQGRFLTRGPGALLQGIMKTKMGFDASKASIIEFRKALADMLTNPKWGVAGMSQKLAKTFIGIKSMISDAVTNIKLTIANSGMFDQVKGFAEEIRQWLRSAPVLKRMRLLGKVITSVVEGARKKFNEMVKKGEIDTILKNWVGIISRVGEVIKNVISNAPQIATIVMNIAESIIRVVQRIAEVVSNLMPKIGVLTGDVPRLTKEIHAQSREWSKQIWVVGEVNKGFDKFAKNIAKVKVPVGDLRGRITAMDEAFASFKEGLDVSGSAGGMKVDILKKYATEIANVQEQIRLIRVGPEGQVGRQAQFDVALESALALYKKIADQETKLGEIAGKRVNKVKEELAAWQENAVTTDSIVGKLAELKAQILGIKYESSEVKKNFSGWKKLLYEMNPISKDLKERLSLSKAQVGGWFSSLGGMLDNFKKKKEEAFLIGDEVLMTQSEKWAKFLTDLVEKWRKTKVEIADLMKGLAEGTAKAFEDIFFDMMMGEMKNLKDYLDSFVRDMARMVAQMMAQRAVMAMMGGKHSGGFAPDIKAQKKAAGGFARGQIGLDRVPIMATDGEMFLNKRQQQNLFNMINRGGNSGAKGVNVNMVNNISAMDGQDAYRTFEKNSDQLVAVIRKKLVGGGRTATMRG